MLGHLRALWRKPPVDVAKPVQFFIPEESDGSKPHRFRMDETPPWDYSWCCEDCHLTMGAVIIDDKYADCLTNMLRRP